MNTSLNVIIISCVICVFCQDTQPTGILPQPHLVILGATGAGKSALANVFLLEDPQCPNCTFLVCPPGDSCTKKVKYAVGRFIGTGPQFTVVDTPGFGDTDGEDSKLVVDMMLVLKNELKMTNAFLLLFDGSNTRFTPDLQKMIRNMEVLFGSSFWNFTILGVSKWSFIQAAQEERNQTCLNTPDNCLTEQSWTADMNARLRQNFKALEFDLEAVFIDSFAKKPPTNTKDPLQQEAFARETSKLWELMSKTGHYEFKIIEDILTELSSCQMLVKKQMTDVWEAIGTLREAEQTIHRRTLVRLQNYTLVPLGTIVPWVMRPSKSVRQDSWATIPDGWQLCDGSTIQTGPWKGHTTPDLNRRELFLRGSANKEYVLHVEEDMLQDHTHIDNGHSHADTGHAHYMHPHYHNFGGKVFVMKESGSPTRDSLATAYGYNGFNVYRRTDSETSRMQSAKANIQRSSANIGGAKNGRTGSETRPKNMRVQYIIRIS